MSFPPTREVRLSPPRESHHPSPTIITHDNHSLAPPPSNGYDMASSALYGKVGWLSSLEPIEPSSTYRKTGLICTIGPKTNTLPLLRELRSEGLNIVRLNFSHGDYDFHRDAISNVRELQKTQEDVRPVAIALDTKGPEIRTGMVEGGEAIIEAGNECIVTTDEEYSQRCDSDYM